MAISEGYVAGLPKAELHVPPRWLGSQRVVAELATRHPGKVPSDPDELARFFVFDDFGHFIRNYLAVVDLIKTAEDVRLITYEGGSRHGGAEHPQRRAHCDALHLDQR